MLIRETTSFLSLLMRLILFELPRVWLPTCGKSILHT